MRIPADHRLGRRDFLRTVGLGSAALLLPERVLADPYAPVGVLRLGGKPVHVRGRVHAGGRGLARVRVSDGLDVVATDGDGRFELMSSDRQPWLSVTVPAGHRMPQNPTGTALFYAPIRADANSEMAAEFALEPLAEPDERHAFLVLADTQTQDAYEMQLLHAETVPDVQETVRSLGGEVFGVACGDIMFDDLSLYPEYERAVAAMGVPFFQVIGNHDLDVDGRSDQLSTQTFQRHFGPEHYSFERGAIHYIVLDDVFWHGAGYLGYLRADALGWLENDLAHVEPGRTVIVFLHIPVLGSQHVRRNEQNPSPGVSVTNREALYRVLEPYNAHLLTGHTHESEHLFEHGVHEHVHGTVCGAWWSGPICHDGTPNGYSVYEISAENVTWRHKSTGLPASHQMRVYGHGADPAAPDEIVANVWDWDADWRVVWYEAGERRGAMARRTGSDPLSVELHTGPEMPSRRTWVEPMPTNHMFYAPASLESPDITVEATDRFGRTHTARLEPA